jgi:hypothetical protein
MTRIPGRIDRRPNLTNRIKDYHSPGVSPQLSTQFASLHAAVCAAEHLIQTGGGNDWITWGTEVVDRENRTVRVDLV